MEDSSKVSLIIWTMVLSIIALLVILIYVNTGQVREGMQKRQQSYLDSGYVWKQVTVTTTETEMQWVKDSTN